MTEEGKPSHWPIVFLVLTLLGGYQCSQWTKDIDSGKVAILGNELQCTVESHNPEIFCIIESAIVDNNGDPINVYGATCHNRDNERVWDASYRIMCLRL